MLRHLIRKEMLDHLLSLRFLILSGIGALVIWLSLYSGYQYYRSQLRDYGAAQELSEQHLQHMSEADQVTQWNPFLELNRNPYFANRPPTPLCIFVRGLDAGMGRSVAMWGTRTGQEMKWSPDAVEPLTGVFPALDPDLVVRVLISLFILLFTYDAVCGEKEAGTLRLLASFPVSKDRLLFAKIFGALIPVGAAFGLPLLLGTAVVLAMPEVQLSGPELTRLALILVAFGVYLTAFTCAGVLASCLVRRSATAFVLLLAFWVTTVVVLPRLSLIVSGVFRPAPSVHEYQTEHARIAKEQLNKHRELRRQWQDAHSEPGREWWRTPEGREAYRFYFDKARSEAAAFFQPQKDRLDESFRNRYDARLALAVALARLSPAFALEHATVRLADTGLAGRRHFLAASDRAREKDQAWYHAANTRYALQQVYPAKYGQPKWDGTDRPRFVYRETWPPEDLRSALADLGILAVFGLLFFAGAYAAVLRYDFR